MTAAAASPGPVVHHRSFGPALPSLDWVPAPRYVLRRDRVMHHLRGIPPCRVLDIGCGPGTLIAELSRRGFDAHGVDGSSKARSLGRHLEAEAPGMHLHAALDPAWKGSFDLLLSFEVLEHIEDDNAALGEWREYLKPGGRLILSTPAHPERWNPADEWAGHVRRYERDQLAGVIQQAGFAVETIECYGFPLANVFEVVRAKAYGRKLAAKREALGSAAALTEDSGSDRSTDSRFWRAYASLPSALAMKAFCMLQRPFLSTELGNGYLVVARAR